MDKLTDYLRYGHVIFRGVRYPADSIRSAVDDLAAYLRREHRGNSPFVYLFAPNHVKTIVSYFATIKAGFVCVLLHPQVGRLELAEYMEDTPPGILIRINSETESLDKGAEIEFRDIRVRLKDDLEGVCTMVYTAADDGYAKAAMLTHESMLTNGKAICECNRVDNSTTSAVFLAVSHLFGMQTGVIAPALAGGGTVLCGIDGLRRLKEDLNQVANASATYIYGVPVVYYLLSKVPYAREALKSAVRLISGGYKLSQTIFDATRVTLGREIHEGYGLTEASPICSVHWPEDSRRIASVGRAFPGCELRIGDQFGSESTSNSSSDTKGEVCVRGRNIMKGYYGFPRLTEKTLDGGWLHTGDKGYLDEGGYLYLDNELNAFVKVAGLKVYTREAERFISWMPNVKSIRLHGVLHEIQGGVVEANVQFHICHELAESELRHWLQKNLSPHKRPRFQTMGHQVRFWRVGTASEEKGA